ncbi:Suppressor of fused protein (SUFU) [Corynebacterium glaucum]|uniref:suppressor of fused domain protein n=1 Tax=Corynebacterium glaucum TaxID=187491 RepID=UPI0025B55FD7|nr:suppressor of fused domain protein [Corynebacterium glaucum]WJZ07342.1 Suppressor of fused protein (SUFU) [Corynebacterium glaucum]
MRWLSEFASRVKRGPRLGGDAILEHITALTGAEDPFVFHYDELEVLAYHVETPLPHTLYVTFGLSRVRTAVPTAGTQTELTLRTPADTPVPYEWPARQLATMVRNVRRSGYEIAPGHHMRMRSPVTDDAVIEAFTFVTDPVLGVIDPPTGIVRFTYAVGLTARELEAALAWDPLRFTGVLGDVVPLGISDPARDDILNDIHVRARVERGMRDEGSSISAVHAKLLSVDATGRIDLDARAAQALIRAARYRLPHGHSFALVCESAWVFLHPEGSFEADAEHIQLAATKSLIHELNATLDTAPGVYRFSSAPVTIHVVDERT